jgi:hypothetical protein
MKRNPAGYMQSTGRHNRRTLEGNGLLARGGKRKGRKGHAGGGRVKRGRY